MPTSSGFGQNNYVTTINWGSIKKCIDKNHASAIKKKVKKNDLPLLTNNNAISENSTKTEKLNYNYINSVTESTASVGIQRHTVAKKKLAILNKTKSFEARNSNDNFYSKNDLVEDCNESVRIEESKQHSQRINNSLNNRKSLPLEIKPHKKNYIESVEKMNEDADLIEKNRIIQSFQLKNSPKRDELPEIKKIKSIIESSEESISLIDSSFLSENEVHTNKIQSNTKITRKNSEKQLRQDIESKTENTKKIEKDNLIMQKNFSSTEISLDDECLTIDYNGDLNFFIKPKKFNEKEKIALQNVEIFQDFKNRIPRAEQLNKKIKGIRIEPTTEDKGSFYTF